MDPWLDILIRVGAVAYIGVGGWMTARLLSRAGIHWWWAILMWAPAVLWVIPGAAIAGLLAAPVPVILTWAFAYSEWPALIDIGQIGQRDTAAHGIDEPPRLSKRARAHTFFAGMDEADADGDEDDVDDDAPPPVPVLAPKSARGMEPTAPYRRTPPPVPPDPDPEPEPVPVWAPRLAADGPEGPPQSWMLSGFDDGGRVVRHQLRAADIRSRDEGYVVGRNPQAADLVLPDNSVSRRHARLMIRGQRLMIEDLGSANGTWLDGRALTPGRASEIEHGASIELGGVKLTLTVA